MTYSITNKTLLFEIVVKFGNSIQEEYMDNEMANVLLQEAIVYFFPEHRVSSYVRFDV
jgi:hypothetical protein